MEQFPSDEGRVSGVARRTKEWWKNDPIGTWQSGHENGQKKAGPEINRVWWTVRLEGEVVMAEEGCTKNTKEE